MAKPEWGVKRACLSCGAHFYDMQKLPIVCPSCEAVFDPEAIFRPRRARAGEETPAAPPANDSAAGAVGRDDVAALVENDADDEDEDDLADGGSEVVAVPRTGTGDDPE